MPEDALPQRLRQGAAAACVQAPQVRPFWAGSADVGCVVADRGEVRRALPGHRRRGFRASRLPRVHPSK